MPADGLLAGAAGVETAAAVEGARILVVEAEAAEAAGSPFGTAGEAADTTGVLREGGVAGAEDTTMAGTLLESIREKTKHRREDTNN